MNSVVLALIAFVCPVAGAAVGVAFRSRLPEHHLASNSSEVIKLAMGLVATQVALILSLLVTSASGFHISVDSDYKRALADVVQLDQYLQAYGPNAQPVRDAVRQIVVQNFQQRWPREDFGPKVSALVKGTDPLIEVERRILELSPADPAQKWFQSQALQLCRAITQIRKLIATEEGGRSLPRPILFVVLICSAAIFASFTLFVEPNLTVAVALMVSALAIAGAFFMIQELNTPFSGLLQLSSYPAHDVLQTLGR